MLKYKPVYTIITFAYFPCPPFLNFGARPEVLPAPRPVALVRTLVWLDPNTACGSAVAPKSLLSASFLIQARHMSEAALGSDLTFSPNPFEL